MTSISEFRWREYEKIFVLLGPNTITSSVQGMTVVLPIVQTA